MPNSAPTSLPTSSPLTTPPSAAASSATPPLSFSRYALAKSLNLPLEMHTSADSETKLFSDEKSITAIEEFMATYILLEDDISILPEEAKVVIGMVKEGRAGEVDWADLMWVLVEKEVLDALRTGRCRYGPHLQRLIQCQRPELLLGEGESVIVPEAESDWSMKISDSVVEEEDKVEEGEEEEEEEKGIEECGTGLSLGLGEKYDAAPPPPEEEKGFEQHCLRRCESIGNERGMEFENLSQGDEKRREEEFENLERLTSADLLHGMETVRVSYDHQINRLEPGNREFLATGVNAGKDIATDTSPGGSLFFGNNGKRHASDDADSDENDQLKRMRTGGLWGEQTPPSNFDSFMEQIQCTVGRAKLIYDEKDQACMNANMEIQYLAEMLEEKDQIIQTLEKTRVDEQQKWQQTVCSYESELNLVADLMLGYKKALKQIERNFTKYRKKFPQGDEPVYRDVPGEGGLVLSARELEKRRLEKEFEMRRIAEEMANDFHASWFAKFEACTDGVLVLQERLAGLDAEIDLLKKREMANRGPGRNKFKWTKEQDLKLIETLQELRNGGEIRPDTYLKAGSLTKIHEKLEQKLPGSGIQKKPHIESRMRVLRENFNIVHALLTGPNCSGFGRDPETKMVTAKDAVWDAYLTSHPEARKFRDAPVKYYDELSMIFGKDRAIGNLAETPADVVEELENQEVNDTMETFQIPVNASSNDSQLPPNSVFDSDVTSRR
ncbi:uncharacterized protein M6B38_102785 [Iris pallida]|uniref:Myb/SANT-like domain-containing protein n=1 Tax=Iris pallida TaxID=29817 RepID=A0AAX6G6A9_IRIPA|nr:uncharacterized protein M6B38_102785 [Iris pallida]